MLAPVHGGRANSSVFGCKEACAVSRTGRVVQIGRGTRQHSHRDEESNVSVLDELRAAEQRVAQRLKELEPAVAEYSELAEVANRLGIDVDAAAPAAKVARPTRPTRRRTARARAAPRAVRQRRRRQRDPPAEPRRESAASSLLTSSAHARALRCATRERSWVWTRPACTGSCTAWSRAGPCARTAAASRSPGPRAERGGLVSRRRAGSLSNTSAVNARSSSTRPWAGRQLTDLGGG